MVHRCGQKPILPYFIIPSTFSPQASSPLERSGRTDNILHPLLPYKINSSPETVVEVVSTLRRNVPYFYDTFWVIKFTLVSALILCLKQPWWSAALAHTITWCMTMPQPSMQVSSSHHGRCHLRLVWAQSIWGATGTWSHHHHVFVRFHGEPAIAGSP